MKLTAEEISRITEIIDRVNSWAKENAQNDFYYGSRYSYYRPAKECLIIDQDEYDLAEKYYGQLWHYRGD
jgi:antirestriction protein ArdC